MSIQNVLDEHRRAAEEAMARLCEMRSVRLHEQFLSMLEKQESRSNANNSRDVDNERVNTALRLPPRPKMPA